MVQATMHTLQITEQVLCISAHVGAGEKWAAEHWDVCIMSLEAFTSGFVVLLLVKRWEIFIDSVKTYFSCFQQGYDKWFCCK